MSTWVEVTEVTPAPASPELLGGAIELPTPGAISSRYALWVSGFAVGAARPVGSVEAINAGEVVQSFPVGLGSRVGESFGATEWAPMSGFGGWLGTLDLAPEFRVELRARLDDAPSTPIGWIAGRAEGARTGYTPVFSPLLLTSMGRTGTTYLMHILAQARDIVCGDGYPYELRIGRYWMHLLGVAAGPADHQRSGSREHFFADPFWAGRNPFFDNQPSKLRDWLQGDAVRASAEHVQRQIDRAYATFDTEQSRTGGPLYFAEKVFPGRLNALAHRLYPGARELVLVRDPRDIYCSVSSFNAKRGYEGFGRDSALDDADYLRRLGGGLADLLVSARARGERALLVRYEDLVSDPDSMTSRICEFLGLDASVTGNQPEEIVRRAEAAGHELAGHRTTPTATESIGRWRRDLPAQLKATSAEFLDESLLACGYEPTS